MNIRIYKFTVLILMAYLSSGQSQLVNTEPLENDLKPDSTNIYSLTKPQSITRNIKQDKNGDIWFATWEGVFKFDGYSFSRFFKNMGMSRFFSVFIDSKDRYWFGSMGSGVYLYDGTTIRNLTTKEGLANDKVMDIFEDSNGYIWLATKGGASRYDDKTFTNFTTEHGLLSNDLNVIIEDLSGKMWLASRGELSIYDGNKFTSFTKKDGKPFMNVRSLILDANGYIWLGGPDGLWLYDGQALKKLSSQFVGYIHEDSDGYIWTSSEAINRAGWVVSRYHKSFISGEYESTPIWNQEGMTFGVLADSNGMVWFGTLDGVCRFNGISVGCFD